MSAENQLPDDYIAISTIGGKLEAFRENGADVVMLNDHRLKATSAVLSTLRQYMSRADQAVNATDLGVSDVLHKVYASKIRKAFESVGHSKEVAHKMLSTVSGRGYALMTENGLNQNNDDVPSSGLASRVNQFGQIDIYYNGAKVEQLTGQESKFIKLILDNKGVVVSEGMFNAAMYPEGNEAEPKLRDVLLAKTRKKIFDSKLEADTVISTRWGRGPIWGASPLADRKAILAEAKIRQVGAYLQRHDLVEPDLTISQFIPPVEDETRWQIRHKHALVKAIVLEQLGVDEVMGAYNASATELVDWATVGSYARPALPEEIRNELVRRICDNHVLRP